MENDKYLSIKELCEYLGITRTTFCLMRKTNPDFPKPIKIMASGKWKKSEIDSYLEGTREK